MAEDVVRPRTWQDRRAEKETHGQVMREAGRQRDGGESPRISMLFMRAAVIKNIFAAADGKLVRVVQPPPAAGNVALTCRTARRQRENSNEGEEQER